MSLILLLGAAGAALLLWPAKTNAAKDPSPFSLASSQTHPSYQTSLQALAAVRLRLLRTDKLDDAAKASIDALTLNLVSGSDQE